jgi:branched-chain amino acid transport system substrate-binding protein
MKKSSRALALVAAGAVVLAACGSSSKSNNATATTTGGAATSAPAGSTSATSASTSSQYKPIPAGPIVFGVSVPLTGATASYGLAAELAFNKVTLPAFNAANPNGIDGHPVQIKILDDASDVTKGVAVAQQLSADHVAAILTVSYNPEAADQQLAVFNKNKIPVLSTLSGSQFADTAKWPYDFGIGASLEQEGTTTAKFIAAKGYTKVATITDGLPQDTDALGQITAAMKTDAPNAQVVKAVTVSPGSVDLSAAVAQLKGANPQALLVYLGFGYGPLWSAMRAASFTPQVIASAGAWYDGFSGMGSLANTAVAPYYDCAPASTTTFPASTTALMAQYAAASGDAAVNYLTYVATDSVPLEMLKDAIEKYHSTDPNAIKAAMESMTSATYEGISYSYSPTNHYGATGVYGAAVCNMNPPYAGGKAKVPVIAQS